MNIFRHLQIKGGKQRTLLYFLLVFVALFAVFSLVNPWRQLYLSNLNTGLSNTLVFWSVSIWLLVILCFYLFFFKKRIIFSFPLLSAVFIVLSLSLSLLLPLTSNDLYSYVYQGRVWSVFGLNPYVHTYSSLFQDNFSPVLNNYWSFRTSPYGPLFTVFSGFFTYIFQASLLGSLLSLKIFFASLNIAVGVLIYRFRFSLASFYLYAFNPLVLFEVAINGHNDICLVFFLIWSIILASRSKNKSVFWSFLLLFFSIAIKYLSLVLIPIWLIIFWREASSRRSRFHVILNFILAGLTSLLLYWYFFPNLSIFIASLLEQGRLVHFLKSPLISWLDTALNFFSTNHLNIAIFSGRIIFLILYLFLLIRVWLHGSRENLLYYSTLAITILLLSFFTWMMPWYLVIPIALFSLLYNQEKYQSLAVFSIVMFTIYGSITYIILR